MQNILNSHVTDYNSNILNILSILSIVFGLYTVISKNPIVSVLFLIGLFSTISLYLITSGLPFIGLTYLLVYVGAISILFIFILMLINIRVSELLTDNNNSIPLAILIILYFSTSLYNLVTHNINNIDILNESLIENIIYKGYKISLYDSYFTSLDNIKVVESLSWDSMLLYISHISSIGNMLYTIYFINFIILSLILLLAMIGAIMITMNKPKPKVN